MICNEKIDNLQQDCVEQVQYHYGCIWQLKAHVYDAHEGD